MESFEIHDGVAALTLSAGKANAMSVELLDTLDALLAQLESSDARAAVVTGVPNRRLGPASSPFNRSRKRSRACGRPSPHATQ